MSKLATKSNKTKSSKNLINSTNELISKQKLLNNIMLNQLNSIDVNGVNNVNIITSIPNISRINQGNLKKIIDKFERAKSTIDRETLLEVTKTLDIHYKDGAAIFIDKNMQEKAGKNVNPQIININNLFSGQKISKKELSSKAIEISLTKYVNNNEFGYSLFENIDTETEFSIGRSGINDTFSNHKNRDLLKYSTANILEKIGMEGIYFVTTSSAGDINNIKYHHFLTAVKVYNMEGNAFVHSVIREFPKDKTKNNSFYYHRLEYLDNNKKGASQGAPAYSSGIHPVESTPLSANNIPQSNNNVNTDILPILIICNKKIIILYACK